MCLFESYNNAKASLFSSEKLIEISECRNFREFFGIINQHLSWDEDYILTEIIDECESDEAKQEFIKYKRKIGVSQALEIINSNESDPPPGFEKFCVVIDKPYKKLTVEEYEEIKTFIFKNLDTHRYVTNKYIRVLFHSLHMEWLVTVKATPHMIRTAYKQQECFKSNCFVLMKIGVQVVIDMQNELTSVS